MQKNTDVLFDEKQNCCYAYTNDGTKFFFDICDAEVISRQGWHLSRRGYIAGKEKRRERPLHKILLHVDSGFDIDHKANPSLGQTIQIERVREAFAEAIDNPAEENVFIIGSAYSDGTHLHYGYRPAGFDKNNGYGGFIDPMPCFEKKEMPEMSKPGWTEVICDDGANVRDAPAGRFATWFPKGIRVRKTGVCQTAGSLVWERIDGGYWIARSDAYGTVMLKDVE